MWFLYSLFSINIIFKSNLNFESKRGKRIVKKRVSRYIENCKVFFRKISSLDFVKFGKHCNYVKFLTVSSS